jgi:endo-1,4-beta-xylanase
MRLLNAVLFLLASFFAVPSLAQNDTTSYTSLLTELRAKLPPEARIINTPGIVSWTVNGTTDTRVVPASDVSGGKAISVVITKARDNPWDIAVTAPILEGVSAGDTLFLAVQVRATSANNEAQSGVIAASKIEEKGGAYAFLAETSAQVSDKWTTLYASGIVQKNYSAGEMHITVHLAAARQTIEIGNAYAFNLGPNVDLASLPKLKITYPGREATAAWRAPAHARIEAIRKGDMTIKVLDASGKAIPGAKVHVQMTGHAFHFGSFVGHNVGKNDADSQKLRESFSQLFNTATSPLYWQDWGWQSPEMRANYLASMKYLAEKKIPWRGHTLIYPGEQYLPAKLKTLGNDPAAYKKAVLDHVRMISAIAAEYKPFTFDVINEPRDDQYTINRIGIDGVAEAFRIAHAAVPDAHLFVNDYGIISGGGLNTRNIAFYHDYLDRLKAAGAPVSGIGMQGHFGAVLTDPVRVLAIYDDFSRHNMPLQITEFDIDTSDEDAQADYTRDLLIASFSHPNIEAFTVWGWWEGDHWRPNGAMVRRDWTAKPNYHAWRKLIFSDWWTNETISSGATGEAKIRGFLGSYKVTVTAGGRAKSIDFNLTRNSGPLEVRL